MLRRGRKSVSAPKRAVSDLLGMFEDGNEIVLSCTSKKGYDTEWLAKFAADEQEERHPGLMLDWYRCRHCGKWHLTEVKR